MRRLLAWVLLVGSLIGWPASLFWWASDEPPFVLSLSWLAITLTSLDILFTAQVKEDGKRDDDHERPGWDEYYLGVAKALSARGDCRRSRVGSVLVDPKNIIINGGYNGFEPGGKSCLGGDCPRGQKSYDEIPAGENYLETGCEANHAELNAVIFARKTNQLLRLHGAVCYITREPCSSCHDLLKSEGIARAVWPDGERSYVGESA